MQSETKRMKIATLQIIMQPGRVANLESPCPISIGRRARRRTTARMGERTVLDDAGWRHHRAGRIGQALRVFPSDVEARRRACCAPFCFLVGLDARFLDDRPPQLDL